MNKITATVVTVLLALTGLAATAPAAHAKDITWGRHAAAPAAKDITWGRTAARKGWPGGVVQHAPDDAGYAKPITVRCSSGAVLSLGLGVRASCGDVDAIWDGFGYQVVCRHTDGRWQVFNRDGYTGIGDWTVVACYHQVG